MRPGDVVWYIIAFDGVWRGVALLKANLPSENHTRPSNFTKKWCRRTPNKQWLLLMPLHFKRWNRPAEFNRMIHGNVDDIGVWMQERTLSPSAPLSLFPPSFPYPRGILAVRIYIFTFVVWYKISAFWTKQHKIKMGWKSGEWAKKKGKRWWIARAPSILFLYDLFLARAP